MILMLAVDENFSIGLNGDLLFHLKKDLKRFKETTMGKTLVMGRKTMDSLPGGRPLKGRRHIVITNNPDYSNEDAVVLTDIDRLSDLIKEMGEDEKDVFLVGGANLVDQLLNKCHKAYITKVHKVYDDFDAAIPNLDKLDNWRLVDKSDLIEERQGDETYSFHYLTYENTDYIEND